LVSDRVLRFLNFYSCFQAQENYSWRRKGYLAFDYGDFLEETKGAEMKSVFVYIDLQR